MRRFTSGNVSDTSDFHAPDFKKSHRTAHRWLEAISAKSVPRDEGEADTVMIVTDMLATTPSHYAT
jgi:hypothetical protein